MSRLDPVQIGTTGASDGDFLGYDPDTDEYGPMAPPGGGSGIVESIVAGTNITVDSTDPANPIVSATGGGGGGALVGWAKASRTAGNVAVSSSTYTDVDTALDLTVPAAAGDLVELVINATATALASGRFLVLDFVTMVSGSPTNSVTTGGAPSTSASLGGWSVSNTNPVVMPGPRMYVIQAGDVVAGHVTFRLRARGSGMTIVAVADGRLAVSVKNFGQ